MIVPNAAAQLLGSSFRTTMRWAVVIGLVCSVAGVVISYEADTPSGGTIVVLTIIVFIAASVGRAVVAQVRAKYERAETHAHEHGPECGHLAVPHHGHLTHSPRRSPPRAARGHYDEHDGPTA